MIQYQIAPKEPTPEMLVAGWEANKRWLESDDESVGLAIIYKAMLDAAPKEQQAPVAYVDHRIHGLIAL